MSKGYVYLLTDENLTPLKAFTKKYEAKHWREHYWRGKPIRVFAGKTRYDYEFLEERRESFLYD